MLNLKTFNGDLYEFIPLWEQFRSAVHQNKVLDSATKLNYFQLKSFSTGRVLETITGLTPSEACYTWKDAIEMFQQEFDHKDKIIGSYVQKFINLSCKKKTKTALQRHANYTIRLQLLPII